MMTLADAKRHREHMCDVYDTTETSEVCGVIDGEILENVNGSPIPYVWVSGSLNAEDGWVPLSNLGTSCKILD